MALPFASLKFRASKVVQDAERTFIVASKFTQGFVVAKSCGAPSHIGLFTQLFRYASSLKEER
jgi:hypothetical protein